MILRDFFSTQTLSRTLNIIYLPLICPQKSIWDIGPLCLNSAETADFTLCRAFTMEGPISGSFVNFVLWSQGLCNQYALCWVKPAIEIPETICLVLSQAPVWRLEESNSLPLSKHFEMKSCSSPSNLEILFSESVFSMIKPI